MDTLLLEVCWFVVVFFLFAVAGWCMEVTLKFIQFHRFYLSINMTDCFL